MPIDMEQFKQTFIEESVEGLDVMESELLSLDTQGADVETINTIFRAAHSIKGGSGTFGFSDIAAFTHVAETLLDQMRSGDREVTQEIVDVLLRSVDVIREMIEAAQQGRDPDTNKAAVIKGQLEAILSGESVVEADAATQEAPKETPNDEAVSSIDGWTIHFAPYHDLLKTGNEPLRMFRELASLGDLTTTANIEKLPTFEELDPTEIYLSWDLEVRGNIKREQICEVFSWVEDECDLTVNPINPVVADSVQAKSEVKPQVKEKTDISKPVDKDAQASVAKGKSAPSETTSIRVSIDKVDALINMVGELVITQSMLGQIGEEFDLSKLDNLRDGLVQLERNTREMQESVMQIRMLPISFAFNRFPRLVHDLSQTLNKKITLEMSGEQTELDKTVMEKIGDPLVHLVRNSLDHGIETPEERVAAGKSETGVIHLNAYHQGGNIVIKISDDGAGLNRERILSKAVSNGLIEEGQDLDAISDEKVFDMIFLPGFSTAEVVSDVSGRGVGMDVVRQNISALGGYVEVKSEQGKGSTFSIRLPLTLAILDGQLVRVGEETYIIPLVSIVESLQMKQEAMKSVTGKAELYRLRDDYIPILRVHNLFEVKPDSEELSNGLLVVVEGANRQKVGLFVDDLLAQQQVVIKSLETNFKRIQGVSGATILGDGTVALILDIPGMINLSLNPTNNSKKTNQHAA